MSKEARIGHFAMALLFEKEMEMSKNRMDEGECLLRIDQFMKKAFKFWSMASSLKFVEPRQTIINPVDIDWTSLKDCVNEADAGMYTLNPHTMYINWGSIPIGKIIIHETQRPEVRPRGEVIKEIMDKFAGTHHFPGIEYWSYLIQNPEKAPVVLGDWQTYLFCGSILHSVHRVVAVPSTERDPL